MLDLFLPIEKLKNVGARNLPRLNKLGIKTLKDLLRHFPVRYEDYSRVVPITDVQAREKVNIQGEVMKIVTKRLFPKRMSVTQALIQDESGAMNAVWFNQPYIANSLREGTFVSLAGKANLDKHGLYLSSPTYEKIDELDFGIKKTNLTHTGGLIPVYPETEGITSKYLRFLIKPILNDLAVSDPLPEQLVQKYELPSLQEALLKIHYPLNLDEANMAKERLAFDDLLMFQLKALLERRKMNQLKSVSVRFDQELIQNFVANLPFGLTKDQKIAAWEILKDLQKKYPMNRLLEGDVGSGKTVVALTGAIQVAKAGYQSVFMAPTEVLAQQHYTTISSLISSRIRVVLLTSSTEEKTKVKKAIADGEADIIIGTHAIIQKDVRFKNLAFVIIDEQHRFGVSQRAALAKNSGSDLVPHLLSMTATPIPRTLALTIYGDLDISIIKEKPKDRQKIITKVISPTKRKSAYQFIRDEVSSGRQIFVICPRIEMSDPKSEVRTGNRQSKMNLLWAEAKAVQEEYKKLSEDIFPDLKVGMLHGKMKPKEKNEIMAKFKDGNISILVSTSVVEVGVDIPNATIMMIENAERFGLAQLHQFRGRVGRGEYQSHCLLLSSTADTTINKRLKALTECDDGFELAEKDMLIRGPGEFFGVKQSGLPDLAMASLANVELIKKARLEAS
ncbi:MAG: ATP-dependent DNA helicase RecG [Candidatus Yanofskybacteria bacterium]|nr:ATP-dependent DNA helicase RecG [Candidatus Yanofskybacteria bacterium]